MGAAILLFFKMQRIVLYRSVEKPSEKRVRKSEQLGLGHIVSYPSPFPPPCP